MYKVLQGLKRSFTVKAFYVCMKVVPSCGNSSILSHILYCLRNLYLCNYKATRTFMSMLISLYKNTL